MTPRHFSAALFLLACLLGKASCFTESIRFEKSDGLSAHYCEACIQYSSYGLKVPMSTTTARLNPTPAPGHTTSFHIVVDFLTGTSDTLGYFTFLRTEALPTQPDSSVRLVFYVDGTSEWVLQVGGEEFPLGASHIAAGSGKHTVTFMTCTETLVIVEDATVITATQRTPAPRITPSFDLTLVDVGATVRTALTEMTFQAGFLPPPPEPEVAV